MRLNALLAPSACARRRVAIGLSCLALLAGLAAPAAGASAPQQTAYTVLSTDGPQDWAAVKRTGATVGLLEHGRLSVRATENQAKAIERLGFEVVKQQPVNRGVTGLLATGFPAADAAYHDYAEMSAALTALENTFPTLASKFEIGNSFQGRKIYAIKISDNVNTNEDEPEILVNANIHAREHLTAEMALYLADLLTSSYASDARIKNIVDTREIWIIPMLNPDGVEYDVSTGGAPYRMKRKNCQPLCDKPDPNDEQNEKGIDLNRNWGFKWASISGDAGSSSNPLFSDYRGASAFESTEDTVLKTWVEGRKVAGVQQIKIALDLHTFSELVLWPFGYTTSVTVSGTMTADQNNVFKTLGTSMARANDYYPGQSSELYRTDGDITDWYWGDQKIFAFTWEMYPKDNSPEEFYPPGTAALINAQTARNKEAFLLYAEIADCPYRAIGKEGTYCPATNDFSLSKAPASSTVAQGGSASTTLTSAIGTGVVQNMTLSATGAPAGVTVGFGAGSIASNGSTSVNFNVAATAVPGVYPITIVGTGTDTVRTTVYTLTVTGNAACAKTNAVAVNLRDAGTASSSVTIAGCAGNGHQFSRVNVKIQHSYVGKLKMYLVAPSGATFLLHDRAGANFDNIERPYLVDLSGESANGIWKLSVDNVSLINGKILNWTLTL